ncbi:GNAT family N-acetyltransferase [Klenkia sp. LSe6-5]|uniref:GNAT family N-acetyltransferase n=1 Tax=Klenkia sesuvii TaxID=3103137 RepID=A0ABU8DV48_9ACTN
MQLTGRADFSVRPATPDDAAEVARVQEVTWRTAFRAFLPAAVLDEWDADAVAAAWRDAVTAPPTPGHGVLVAQEGAAVVGFVAYGPAELSPAERSRAERPRAELPRAEAPSGDGPAGELTALLVEPRWGRRGHGSRLLAAAVDVLAAAGVRELCMWVPDDDTVTPRFLASAGWAADSWTRGLEADGRTIRERRWHALIAEDGEQA